MADDIVTRLRRVAQQKIEGHSVTPSPKQLLDACDEIERLRAQVADLCTAGDALAYAFRHTGGLDVAYDAPLRAWEEARRG